MAGTLLTASRNVGILTVSHVGCRCLHLVLISVVARLLGPNILGDYAIAAALSTLLLFLTDIGVSPRLVRELAANPERSNREYAQAAGLKLVIAGVAMLVVPLIILQVPIEAMAIQLCLLMALAAVIESLSAVNVAVCQAHERMDLEALGAVAQSLVFVGGSLGCLLAGLSPLSIGYAAICGSAAELLISTACARRFVRLGVELPRGPGGLRAALPYAANSLAVIPLAQLDVVVLSLVASEAAVGEYAAISRLLLGGASIPLLAATALLPTATGMYLRYGGAQFHRINVHLFDMTLLLAGGTCIGLIASAPLLMAGVYGPEFGALYPLLQIGSVFIVLRFLSATLSIGLTASGRQRARARAVVLGFGITGAAILLLGPTLGVRGAVLALSVGEGAVLAGLLAAGPGFARALPLTRTVWRVAAASGSALVVYCAVPATHPWLAAALPLLVYGTVLLLSGEAVRVWRLLRTSAVVAGSGG